MLESNACLRSDFWWYSSEGSAPVNSGTVVSLVLRYGASLVISFEALRPWLCNWSECGGTNFEEAGDTAVFRLHLARLVS